MDVQKVRVRNSNRSSPVFNHCSMHSWWPQVRKWSGKKFFKEKSGNLTSSQRKFKSWKEVREQ